MKDRYCEKCKISWTACGCPAEHMVEWAYNEFTRERQLETAINDLWRNFPEWPSTFGNCANPDCSGAARGSGLCRDCVTECIAEITGDRDAATALRVAIESVRTAALALRNMVKTRSV